MDFELDQLNYKLFRRDRKIKDYQEGLYTNVNRGGVLTFTKNNLNSTVSDMNDNGTETLWVNINPTPGNTLLLGNCYRPELAGEEYVERMCKTINTVGTQEVGDFNFRDIDWTSTTSSRTSNIFLDTLEDNYLQQMITEPTRNKYINDLLLCGNPSIIHNINIGNNFGNSDHKIVEVDAHLFVPWITRAKRKVYLYSKGDYTSLQFHANSLNWEQLLGKNTLMDHKWEKFKEIYKQLIDEYIPVKMMIPGHRPKPLWISDKRLKKLRARKRTAKINYNKSKLHADKLRLDETENKYKQQITQSKAHHEELLARNIKNNPRRFYNYTKNYTKPKSRVECLIVNSMKVTDNEKKS